jgi:hypothetical protein
VKSKEYRNIITDARVVCINPRDIRLIEGVEYLVVTQPGHYNNRSFMIRKDSLRLVEKPVNKH